MVEQERQEGEAEEEEEEAGRTVEEVDEEAPGQVATTAVAGVEASALAAAAFRIQVQLWFLPPFPPSLLRTLSRPRTP